jgi:hypothetical protein
MAQATKLDLRRELKTLYGPPAGRPGLVDVPELSFLMVDGQGDPNVSQDYRDAVQALFAVAYAVKFAVKRAAGIDYRVMPLEGLWWVDDMSTFTMDDKASWQWTALIAQPDLVNAELVQQAVATAAAKRPLPRSGGCGWNTSGRVGPPSCCTVARSAPRDRPSSGYTPSSPSRGLVGAASITRST